jgi:hypothetical protein
MKLARLAFIVVGLAQLPLPAAGQAAFDVVNPNLRGLVVSADASWSSAGYYEYRYIVSNGSASSGALLMFQVDVTQRPGYTTGSNPGSGGPGLILPTPGTTPAMPVGIVVPANWNGSVSVDGLATWGIASRINNHLNIAQMAPGTSSPTLVLRAYDPPGARAYTGVPVWHASDPGSLAQGSQDVDVTGQTLGPVPATATEIQNLFRGGSNNPAVVDHFLSYRVPSQKSTTLSAGQKALVVVHFGDTTIPTTFTATWNGMDISTRFAPVPGKFGAVTLDPKSGRNELVISISGTKTNGGTGTDTDRLLWDAP